MAVDKPLMRGSILTDEELSNYHRDVLPSLKAALMSNAPENWPLENEQSLDSSLDDYTINVETPIGPLSYGSSTSNEDLGYGYTATTDTDKVAGKLYLESLIKQAILNGETPPEWALKAYGNYSKTKWKVRNPEEQTVQKDVIPQYSAGLEYTDPKGLRVRGSASDDTRRETYGAGVDTPVGGGMLSADVSRTTGDRQPIYNGNLLSPNEWKAMLGWKGTFETGGMVRNPYPYEPKTI